MCIGCIEVAGVHGMHDVHDGCPEGATKVHDVHGLLVGCHGTD